MEQAKAPPAKEKEKAVSMEVFCKNDQSSSEGYIRYTCTPSRGVQPGVSNTGCPMEFEPYQHIEGSLRMVPVKAFRVFTRRESFTKAQGSTPAVPALAACPEPLNVTLVSHV